MVKSGRSDGDIGEGHDDDGGVVVGIVLIWLIISQGCPWAEYCPWRSMQMQVEPGNHFQDNNNSNHNHYYYLEI